MYTQNKSGTVLAEPLLNFLTFICNFGCVLHDLYLMGCDTVTTVIDNGSYVGNVLEYQGAYGKEVRYLL